MCIKMHVLRINMYNPIDTNFVVSNSSAKLLLLLLLCKYVSMYV